MTKQKLETLIVRTLSELQLRGHIVNTVDIDDELGILCSVVSLQSGTRHVFMDLFRNQDDGSVIDEIKHQLTLGLN